MSSPFGGFSLLRCAIKSIVFFVVLFRLDWGVLVSLE